MRCREIRAGWQSDIRQHAQLRLCQSGDAEAATREAMVDGTPLEVERRSVAARQVEVGRGREAAMGATGGARHGGGSNARANREVWAPTKERVMKKILLIVAFTLAMVSTVTSQALHCPICSGPNSALQYNGTACICGTISGVVGPTGPIGPQGPIGFTGPAGPAMPASPCAIEGYTERWSGTAWVCTPTKFILAQ